MGGAAPEKLMISAASVVRTIRKACFKIEVKCINLQHFLTKRQILSRFFP